MHFANLESSYFSSSNKELEAVEYSHDFAVIQEVYDGEYSPELFENELERALHIGVSTIIIEPNRLGEETSRWIALGNCLHKTAVGAGFGSLLSNFIWPDKLYLSCPFAAISCFCAGLYTVSWQTDPCCKYQVENDAEKIKKLRLDEVTSGLPVVLIRRDDTTRKILHSSFALLATGTCLWRFYKSYE